MDDLTRIKGIGKATARKLAEAGFGTFEKLAHDGIAGEHGIEAAWIAEAARLHHENIEGKPPRPDDEQGAVDGAPADGGAGDPHTNNPEGSSGTSREDPSTDGGTSAEAPNVGTQSGSPHTNTSDASQADQGGGGAPKSGAPAVPLPDGPYRREFPLLSAAIDAWRAANPDAWPTIVRIRSKREGFRRCNVAHRKAATDHPAGRFAPAEMERLLAEAVLTVELV